MTRTQKNLQKPEKKTVKSKTSVFQRGFIFYFLMISWCCASFQDDESHDAEFWKKRHLVAEFALELLEKRHRELKVAYKELQKENKDLKEKLIQETVEVVEYPQILRQVNRYDNPFVEYNPSPQTPKRFKIYSMPTTKKFGEAARKNHKLTEK